MRYFLADLAYLDDSLSSGVDDLPSGDHDLASGEDEPASAEDEGLEKDSPEQVPEDGDFEEGPWDDEWSEKESMENAVSWNAYWAHPENVLVAMFHDEDIKVRQRACDIVLDLQQRQIVKDQQQMEEDGELTVREFIRPSVKWEAESYTDFLDLVEQEEWTCLPVFLGVAEDVLRAGVAGGRSKDIFDLVGFPNNTRCVELRPTPWPTPSARRARRGSRSWPWETTRARGCRCIGRRHTGHPTTSEVLKSS